MHHIGCNESCFNRGVYDNDPKNVSLVFNREQLLYDIKNCAYIEGHVWDGENQHARHTLVEIGEEGNIDRVNSVLEVAHAEVVEILYPYTKQAPVNDEVITDRMVIPKEYRINMSIPPTMSRTTLKLLNGAIHEFMVARVLYDWLSITHAEAAPNWLEKAQSAKDEIKSIKQGRSGVLRRSSHPL